MKIWCDCCEKKFDTEDCNTDKYWKEDRQGMKHHLMSYQCPHCGKWVDEDEINEVK